MPSPAQRYGAFALSALGVILRVVAIFIAIVIVMLCFPTGPFRQLLLMASTLIDSFVPGPLSGLFVFLTPFGGAFRGDYAILALVLFGIDYACQRGAYALKNR